MKEIISNDLVQELHKFTRRLAEVIEHDFLALSDRQMQWQASPEKWSIAHCLHHLNIVSDYYHIVIAKSIKQAQAQGSKPNIRFKSGWLGQKMIASIQLDKNHKPKRKLRVPSSFNPVEQVAQNSSAAILVRQYLAHQKYFMQLLDQAQKVNLTKVRAPIAILKFIKLRLGDILQFVLYHNERHIVQALRVRYHPNFPKN